MTFILALIGYVLSVVVAFVAGFGVTFWYISDKYPEEYKLIQAKMKKEDAKNPE